MDAANSRHVSVPGLDALSFVSSLSPASPVSLILYKFVGFVLKFTRVFPDRPPPWPPHTRYTVALLRVLRILAARLYHPNLLHCAVTVVCTPPPAP